MTIDLVNISDKDCPLRTQKWYFKISKFSGGECPQTPLSSSPLQHSRDSVTIEKYPDFTYSKGWTV